MSSKSTPRPWQTGLLALGLLAGCGGSASRHDPDAQPPGPTGGAASDPPRTAGESGTGGAVGLAGGGNGTSAGGAPAGGSSQDFGGSAGAGAAPSLTLPPGCLPRSPMETADICSLALDCDTSPSVRTYCHRLDSGQWECQCSNHERMYRLENAAGIHACALAARLCSDEDLELGEESCEHSNASGGQESCSSDVTCRKPIELDATTDAQAWLVRFGSVRCDGSDGAEAFYCDCSNGALKSNYHLLADSGELACGPLADFCMSGAIPVFDGEEECFPVHTTSDSAECHHVESCGLQMVLTDEVSLVQLEQRNSNCVAGPDGGSECSCYNHASAFSFQLSAPPDDASCESSIANCDPNAVIEPTGPASCEPLSFDTHGDDMCAAFLMCDQEATVDNRSIVAHGNMGLLCRRAETGMPWWCSCASAQETAKLELGAAGADATQACNQAIAACLEQLGVQLGPATDPIQPPDPLP